VTQKNHALVRGCPTLTKLDISRSSMTGTGLIAIRYHCRHLKHIELTKLMFPRCVFDRIFFPRRAHVGLNRS
jgi:hypothetical protein